LPEDGTTKAQELIYELRVGEVVRKNVITVSSSTPMSELREVLRENRISGTPVVDDERLVGLISIEDFIGWLVDGGPHCPISERMSTELCTIYDDEPLIRAVNKLARFGFGRLPVVHRDNEHLIGVITKGDILRGLLRKLEVDFREAEIHDARSKYVFQDIVADRSALILEYVVTAEDFSRAGACASGLKTTLRRLGIPPKTARRAAIAAYEAEMNLVFYAGGGRITAKVDPEAIRLDVTDSGPGIPDIEQAMRPGFTTAPDWVRELGFGAGMGLHNIRNCADRMNLTSTVGKGTRLEVDILLEQAHDAERDRTTV
jgi:CBS domain-containing protein/anti-sigma regulatory factor (Ser/Thr protein kinase)